MSNWPSGTSTLDTLPSDMSESLFDEIQFNTMFNSPSGTFDTIESIPEMQSPERQFDTISNWFSGTSTSPILPPNMMETLSETQPHERQDISQHIRQQNVDGAKTRKTRSQVWEDFDKYTDENGKDRARCKICKDLDGSSKPGTTHLKNHFKSCKRKRNEGGGGDNLAGNLSDTNAIKGKSVMDQQLNRHLVSDEVRMITTEERSKQVHNAIRAPSTERGQSHSLDISQHIIRQNADKMKC